MQELLRSIALIFPMGIKYLSLLSLKRNASRSNARDNVPANLSSNPQIREQLRIKTLPARGYSNIAISPVVSPARTSARARARARIRVHKSGANLFIHKWTVVSG